MGLEVYLVRDGSRAIEIAQQFRPDVIVLNVIVGEPLLIVTVILNWCSSFCVQSPMLSTMIDSVTCLSTVRGSPSGIENTLVA